MGKYELVFKDNNDELIVITTYVVERLLSFRQLSPMSYEAAGVLIGERRGVHIVIHDLSEPGKGDVRTRFSVNRCGPHHQVMVDSAFYHSDGTMQYLGEWHTHPEDYPNPSLIDRTSWQLNLKEIAPVVLIIVGTKGVWVAKKVNGDIIELSQV